MNTIQNLITLFVHSRNSGCFIAAIREVHKRIKRTATDVHQVDWLGEILKTPSMRMRRLLCQAIAYSYDAEQDAYISMGDHVGSH